MAAQSVIELQTRRIDYPPVYAVVESITLLVVLGVLEFVFGWRARPEASGAVLTAIALYFLLFSLAAGNDSAHNRIWLAFLAGAIAAATAARAARRPVVTALWGILLAIGSYVVVIAFDAIAQRAWPG
jgi:hypothetical protein